MTRVFAPLTLVLVLIVGLAGCSSSPYSEPLPIQYTSVKVTTVGTPGTTITATDGSFSLRPGEVYATPYRSEDCPTNPKTEEIGLVRGGAVTIEHPHYTGKLYGKLTFCKIELGFTGPAARSNLIQIPNNYVEATSGNRVAVVYESVGSGPSWILWLSRIPL